MSCHTCICFLSVSGDRLVLHVLPHSFPPRCSSVRGGDGATGQPHQTGGIAGPARGNRIIHRGVAESCAAPDGTGPSHYLRGQSWRDEARRKRLRSEEHTSELQSLMRISYAVFCLQKKTNQTRSLQ